MRSSSRCSPKIMPTALRGAAWIVRAGNCVVIRVGSVPGIDLVVIGVRVVSVEVVD